MLALIRILFRLQKIYSDIPGINELYGDDEIINVESGDDTDDEITEKQIITVFVFF